MLATKVKPSKNLPIIGSPWESVPGSFFSVDVDGSEVLEAEYVRVGVLKRPRVDKVDVESWLSAMVKQNAGKFSCHYQDLRRQSHPSCVQWQIRQALLACVTKCCS